MSTAPAVKALLFGLVAVTLLVGCGENEKPPVKAAEVKSVAQNNFARSSIGLRLIQDDWVLARSEFGADDWQASESDKQLRKRVFKGSAGNVVEEEDYYYSGAKFTDREGTWSEFVTVNYDYKSKRIRVLYTGTNQSIETVLSPFGSYSGRITEALAAVESVVKNW